MAPSEGFKSSIVEGTNQEGAGISLDAFISYHEARAFQIAKSITGSEEEAEQILAETFGSAFEKLGSKSDEDWDVSAWIFAQVVEHSLARLEAARASVDALCAAIAKDGGDSGDGAHSEPEALATQLRRLPEEHKRAFLLHDVVGLRMEQISKLFSVPGAQLRHILYRARSTLRRCVTHPTPLSLNAEQSAAAAITQPERSSFN